MAKWVMVKNKEILRVSNLDGDIISEIKDLLDKKKIETDKLKNIEQVIAMSSATRSDKIIDLMKSRSKIINRVGMIDSALEVLNTQTYKS